MKLNNKGMTLIELLISLALISFVMVFLLQMLENVRNDSLNDDFAISNQSIRDEIIYTIEKDLLNESDFDIINNCNSNDLSTCTINITSNSSITISKDTVKEDKENKTYYYLTYNNNDNIHKWQMKDATIDTNVDIIKNNNYAIIKIKIYNEIFNELNNINNNNTLDDIEISLYGIIT